jgi:hypothetical protein
VPEHGSSPEDAPGRRVFESRSHGMLLITGEQNAQFWRMMRLALVI